VFEFDRRLRALERAFYRHVLRVVDLDALFDLEQRLWVRLADRGRLTDDQVLDLSNAIVERAFDRLGRDPIRAMQEGVIGPDGRIAPVPRRRTSAARSAKTSPRAARMARTTRRRPG
jgi:hypothetical protein